MGTNCKRLVPICVLYLSSSNKKADRIIPKQDHNRTTFVLSPFIKGESTNVVRLCSLSGSDKSSFSINVNIHSKQISATFDSNFSNERKDRFGNKINGQQVHR